MLSCCTDFKFTMGGKGMTEQIHKRFTEEQVKTILDRYIRKELGALQAMDLLDLRRRQFFKWVKRYKEDPAGFTIAYHRDNGSRSISKTLEENILSELRVEEALIHDPAIPIRFYNYSFIKDQLNKKYRQKVSLPTIIDRAKKTVFTLKKEKRKSMTVR